MSVTEKLSNFATYLREMELEATGVAGKVAQIQAMNDSEEDYGGGWFWFVGTIGTLKGIILVATNSVPATVAIIGSASTVGLIASAHLIGFSICLIAVGAFYMTAEIIEAPPSTFFKPFTSKTDALKRASTIITAPISSALYTVEQIAKCVGFLFIALGAAMSGEGDEALRFLRRAGDAMIKVSFNLGFLPVSIVVNLIDFMGSAIKAIQGGLAPAPVNGGPKLAQKNTNGVQSPVATDKDDYAATPATCAL